MQQKMVHLEVSEDIPLEEFRSLLGIFDTKIAILYRECRFDQEKVRHIQSMRSILSAMTVLINRIHQESKKSSVVDNFTDARGFTYQMVRSCDLERISDK